MVVFKKDHLFVRGDRSHACVFAEQLQSLFRVEVNRSFDLFQLFDECFSGSHAYTLQSGTRQANPSKVTDQLLATKRAQT